MLDISTIKDLDSADVEILHPTTKAPLGAVITIAGPEHPVRRKLSFDRQRRIRADMAKHGRIRFGDPESEFAEEIQELAACTLAWKGLSENGKELPFAREAAERLYTNCKWLREQVSEALNTRENFIEDSKKS